VPVRLIVCTCFDSPSRTDISINIDVGKNFDAKRFKKNIIAITNSNNVKIKQRNLEYYYKHYFISSLHMPLIINIFQGFIVTDFFFF